MHTLRNIDSMALTEAKDSEVKGLITVMLTKLKNMKHLLCILK